MRCSAVHRWLLCVEGCFASCLLAVLLVFIGACSHIPQVDVVVMSSGMGCCSLSQCTCYSENSSSATPGHIWCWVGATFERREGARACVCVLFVTSVHHCFIYFVISRVTCLQLTCHHFAVFLETCCSLSTEGDYKLAAQSGK